MQILVVPYKTIIYMKLGFKKKSENQEKIWRYNKYEFSKNHDKQVSIENTYRINNQKSNIRVRLLRLKMKRKVWTQQEEKRNIIFKGIIIGWPFDFSAH